MLKRRAIVLLSGGLNFSATTLAIATAEGDHGVCHCGFQYGQRHAVELAAAARVAKALGVEEHRPVPIDLAPSAARRSPITSIAVPEAPWAGIPVTYVPARNTVFLSWRWVGVRCWRERPLRRRQRGGLLGYPDCRPEFIAEFETLANLATKAGVEGDAFRVHTPLIG